MPLWDVNLNVVVRGVGTSKNIKLQGINAPSLAEAITIATKGLVSISVVKAVLSDPATDDTITPIVCP